MENDIILDMKGIDKSFSGVKVLDNVDFRVKKGSIHALVGENGAGKSTLVKIITGVYKKDAGNITFLGEAMTDTNINSILQKGVSMVYQELMSLDNMSVAENIFVGREPYKINHFLIDRKKMIADAKELLTKLNIPNIQAEDRVKDLSVSKKQMLEIAKAVSYDSKLIILDEPTVAVDPQSRNNILEGILALNKEGATIIYTSHYMDEVEKICSRIMIMDQGQAIATGTTEELKSMISSGERITIDLITIEEETLSEIRKLAGVRSISYENDRLSIQSTGEQPTLYLILEYLKKEQIAYGNAYAQMPTLNDVFLEITGKELRD